MPNETGEGPPEKVEMSLFDKVSMANAEEEMAKILSSSDPLGTMRQWGEFIVPHKRAVQLRKAMTKTDDPEEKRRVCGQLVFWCVPTICKSVESVRELGVEDADLIARALEGTIVIIKRWEPPEEGKKVRETDRLRNRVSNWLKGKLREAVTTKYDLVEENIDVVRLYFQALKTVYGDEEKEVDLLALVHRHHFRENEGRLGSLPDRDRFVDPKKELSRSELSRLLASLGKLTEKERNVLTWRLDSKESYTLDDIAKIMGVTKEWIRQIEAKALRKLRHSTKTSKLRSFLK